MFVFDGFRMMSETFHFRLKNFCLEERDKSFYCTHWRKSGITFKVEDFELDEPIAV